MGQKCSDSVLVDRHGGEVAGRKARTPGGSQEASVSTLCHQ